jgi:hypothetical protein
MYARPSRICADTFARMGSGRVPVAWVMINGARTRICEQERERERERERKRKRERERERRNQ